MIIQKKKDKAFSLRKSGKSYGHISNYLGINKSTLAYWFKDVDWSKDLKNQLINKAKESSRKRLERLNILTKEKWDKRYQEAELEAKAEFHHFRENRLFITALSLYWGEGDKIFKNGIVRISNIDEKLLKIFVDFLRKICRIEDNKIGVSVLLYPDLEENRVLKFWSESINISRDRFFKPTIIGGKHKTNRLGNGVGIVSVHNKYLKKKVLVWLELFKKEF